MRACHFQDLLFFFLLGFPFLTLAQGMYCHKSVFTGTEEDPNTFNWTAEQVETCGNGKYCQETVLMIKAGPKTGIFATKGCMSEVLEESTFVQHSAPPGLTAVSYSSYCENSLCNDRENVPQFMESEEISDSDMSATLHCPTCVALGSCWRAPSLPCPNGTTRCYRGKLELTEGGIDASVEVRGCTSIIGCRLMAGISTVGPILVKEVCPSQSLTQPRKAESGATWLPISVWSSGRLLPLLLHSLVHFS